MVTYGRFICQNKLICDMVDFWRYMVLKTCYMVKKNLPYYRKKRFLSTI